MKKCVSFLFVFMILAAVTAHVRAQSQTPSLDAQLWMSRAESVTDNILRDSSKLSEVDKSLVLAKLGDAWWKIDSDKSTEWFVKAVDGLYFLSSNERRTSQNAYLETSRKILQIIGNRVDKQRDRLIGILAEISDVSQKEKELNADSLVEYGLQNVRDNPRFAHSLGTTAIGLGSPRFLYKLIWELNRQQPDLAVQLFNAAVGKAGSDPSFVRLQTIQLAAFPQVIVGEVHDVAMLERKEKLAALRFFAQYIIQAALSSPDRGCSGEARLIGVLHSQFVDLLPSEAATVQSAVAKCLGVSNEPSSRSLDPTNGLTIDDLLKLANEQKENHPLRAIYLTRAGLLARDQEKYATSIKVLDGMTEKERNIDENLWDDLRADVSSRFAFALRKGGDELEATRILQNTPASIRAFARLGFLKRSGAVASGDQFIEDVLNAAVVEIVKAEKPLPRKLVYWFGLIEWAGKRGFADIAVNMLRDLANSFNSSLSEKSMADFEIRPIDIGNPFSEKILIDQDAKLFDNIGRISKPRSRINLNLSVLSVVAAKCLILLPKNQPPRS